MQDPKFADIYFYEFSSFISKVPVEKGEQDNCPLDNWPPDNCPLDNCPPDKCPPDN